MKKKGAKAGQNRERERERDKEEGKKIKDVENKWTEKARVRSCIVMRQARVRTTSIAYSETEHSKSTIEGVLSWPVLGVVVIVQSRSLVTLRHPDSDPSGFEGLHGCLGSSLGSLLLPRPRTAQGTESLRLDHCQGRADGRATRGRRS